MRISQHRSQPWWPDVAYAEFSEVLEGDLLAAEDAEIARLRPLYNFGGAKYSPPLPSVPEPDRHDAGADFRAFLRGLITAYLNQLDASVRAVLDQLIEGA